MIFLKKMLFLVLSISSLLLEGQETHPLDKKYEECLNSKQQTTLHTNECLQKAFIDWDKQLNKDYQALREKLSPAQKAKLKVAQLKWLSFRDTEFLFIETQFKNLEGIMYPNLILSKKIRIVKNRVLELEQYIKFYETF